MNIVEVCLGLITCFILGIMVGYFAGIIESESTYVDEICKITQPNTQNYLQCKKKSIVEALKTINSN